MESQSISRQTSDLDFVKRAQRGDADAFSALFHAHRARVYALCLRMTNNTAEAEDLTQDAFLQVFRKLATFRGDSALSTWLYRVAMNTVLMHFRKKSLPKVSLDDVNREETRHLKREYGGRDGQLWGAVDRIALARAMKELPSGYRTIFLLHEVKGYEHQEIARRLRCSVGNSKSQLHKAKLKMRELLRDKHRAALAQSAIPSNGIESRSEAIRQELLDEEPHGRELGNHPLPKNSPIASDTAI